MTMILYHEASAHQSPYDGGRWLCQVRRLPNDTCAATVVGASREEAEDLAKLLSLSLEALEAVKLVSNGDPRHRLAVARYLAKVPRRFLGGEEG